MATQRNGRGSKIERSRRATLKAGLSAGKSKGQMRGMSRRVPAQCAQRELQRGSRRGAVEEGRGRLWRGRHCGEACGPDSSTTLERVTEHTFRREGQSIGRDETGSRITRGEAIETTGKAERAKWEIVSRERVASHAKQGETLKNRTGKGQTV